MLRYAQRTRQYSEALRIVSRDSSLPRTGFRDQQFAPSNRHLASDLDRMPATRPLSADLPDGEAIKYPFDHMSYAKAAAIMRQLESAIGGTPLRNGIVLYLSEYAYGCSSTNDCIQVAQACTSRNLGHWFDRWVIPSGINTLRPSSVFYDEGVVWELAVLQSPSPGFNTLRRLVTKITTKSERQAPNPTPENTRGAA